MLRSSSIPLDLPPRAHNIKQIVFPERFFMFLRPLLLSSAAFALTATTALADLKAQDVWMDWKSYIQGFGYSVQGAEATSGDRLTVSDLTLTIPLPEQNSQITLDMGAMSFTSLADGTVQITVPDRLPMAFNMVSDGESELAGTLTYDTTDLSLIVSGTPDDMTYDTSAATLDMSLANLTVEGKPVDIGTLAMTMAGLTGTSNMKLGTIRNVVQSFAVDRLSYTVDLKAPDLETFKMTGALNALSFNGTGAYPNAGSPKPQNISALLASGFAFDGGFAYQNGNSTFEISESGQKTSGASSSQSGLLKVAMSAAGLHYGGEVTALSSTMTNSQFPLPVALTAEKSAFALTMPISASDEAQDYGFKIELSNFTTSEMLWAMVDPTAQLPRNPATLHIDLSGKAKLLFDMLDPDSIAALEAGAQSPGEVNSVTLNALELSAAGASLTGTGAFQIDNTDTRTFAGVPKPVGAVDLKLVGGNGLIDKLVAMGLLPEDQAMGARMMMGLFTIPSETPDTLTSKIEVTEQGHVLANGQRLR